MQRPGAPRSGGDASGARQPRHGPAPTRARAAQT